MSTLAAPYDFNTSRTKRETFAASFSALIDAAEEEADASVRKPRDYLGASQIGDECARRIQYDMLAAPAAPFDGKSLRIFDRGHTYEAKAAAWLRRAGFVLATHKPNSDAPFGFSVAGGRFRGHVDGIIFAGPAIEGLVYPTIWENKALGEKGWKALAKDGVAKAHPRYADQIALYQTYMDNQNSALLTAQNANTMEIWAEIVPFDPARAQAASDRAVAILRATDANDLLPRVSDDPGGFPCHWCKFKAHCWKGA